MGRKEADPNEENKGPHKTAPKSDRLNRDFLYSLFDRSAQKGIEDGEYGDAKNSKREISGRALPYVGVHHPGVLQMEWLFESAFLEVQNRLFDFASADNSRWNAFEGLGKEGNDVSVGRGPSGDIGWSLFGPV